LQQALADRLVVDLKPFATNAQRKITAAIADLQKNEEGIRVDADVNSIRLAGIAFDSKTLRVIVETDGTIKAAVTALPAL
ncbi:MAG TPA: DUF4403 family protein, partial [Bradyrhizobium sp.]